ncbi:uncharacterized protein TNCV_717661 [Trichonephila clavipes]|nr:uncharacterized protein TNCV_717661 [Trichonephila clavipes]
MKTSAKWYFCLGSVIEVRERQQDFVIKFPSRRYPSYCTTARAVQRFYKAGNCHRRIPLSRTTPLSLRIPAEDVLGYVLTHPESSVWDILARLVPTQN